MPTQLSVNINKIATLRNARGGSIPNVVQFAKDCERFGAQGITVHPRSDERHITYDDVFALKEGITTEFNIEGYPDERWLKLVEDIKPAQATLVPDSPDQLTSDHGWDTIKHKDELIDITQRLKSAGCRVSLFADPDESIIEGAKEIGADRVELYTGPFAWEFEKNPDLAVSSYLKASQRAKELGIGLNAGHDLSLENLQFIIKTIPWIDEVSIGHAIIADALYYGMETTIGKYLTEIKEGSFV